MFPRLKKEKENAEKMGLNLEDSFRKWLLQIFEEDEKRIQKFLKPSKKDRGGGVQQQSSVERVIEKTKKKKQREDEATTEELFKGFDLRIKRRLGGR